MSDITWHGIRLVLDGEPVGVIKSVSIDVKYDAPRVVQVEPGTLYVGGASSGSLSVERTLVNWPAVREMHMEQLRILLAGRTLNNLPTDEALAVMQLVQTITELEGRPDEFAD